MRRAILLLVSAAACKTEGMLEVRVFPPKTGHVDYVELFIGVPDKHYPANVRPAQGLLAPTVWWERYPTPEFDIQPMADDGTLYQLIPGGITDDVGALVAVGYQLTASDKAPVAIAVQLASLEIPDDELHRYKLTLGDVDPLPGDLGTDRPGVPGLQMWGPKDDPRLCVQVNDVPELVSRFPNAKSAMIVKSGDHDCDTFLDDEEYECKVDEFLYADPVARNQLSCLTELDMSSGPGNTSMCFVGSNSCADGVKRGDCAPSNYCAPTELCKTGCTDINCPMLPTGAPFFLCTIPYLATGNGPFCSGAHATLSLAQAVPGIACSTDPAAKIRDLFHPFGPSFTISSATGGDLTFGLEPLDPSKCLYSLTVTGIRQLDGNNAFQNFYPMVVAAPLVLPVKDRGLAVPIIVNGTDTMCADNAGTCIYVNGQSDSGLAACVSSAVNRSSIVTD